MFQFPESRVNLNWERSREEVRRLVRKAIMRRRLPFFRKLLKEDEAWALFVMVIKKYIKQAKERKLSVNLAKASPELKRQLELMDQEVATLEWMIEIPARTIRYDLIKKHEEKEREIVEEIQTEMKEE